MKGSKVVVTGACGFIGSHLCERLVGLGANVKALVLYNNMASRFNLEFLDRQVLSELNIQLGNVADRSFMASLIEGADYVFHLAALIGIPYSYVAPQSYVDTNIIGTLNVLEALKNNPNAKLIHTSTSEVFGSAQHVPMNETHPIVAQSPYAATKIAADKLVESYHRAFSLPVTTVRPFNTYGPRQSCRAVIPTIISQALSSDHVKLGDLTPIRDLTYVTDTVEGFIKAAVSQKNLGIEVNLGTGTGVSIGDLATTILGLIGVNKPIEADASRIRPTKSEVRELLSDNNLAKELLEWQPTVALEQGLGHTIEFFTRHTDSYNGTLYQV